MDLGRGVSDRVFERSEELFRVRECAAVAEQGGVYQVRLVAGLGGQAEAFADHPADAVHRFGRLGEGDHGGVGGHDVFVGDPESRALGRDAGQLRRPLLPVAPPEGVFGDSVALMRGEQPGDAYVEGFRGTHQQGGLCLLQALLYLPER